MFHKQYYKLEEAAEKLGVDVDVLIDIHCKDKCQLCIVFQTPKHAFSFDLINGKEKELTGVFINKPYPIVYGEIEGAQIAVELIKGLQVNCPLVYDLEENSNTPDFLEMTEGNYPAYPVGFDESLFDDDNYVSYWDWALSVIESDIYLTDIVLTHQELTRLLALKAEHDGKPTLEQVKTENEVLKLRIAELEAAQIVANSEISSKSKAPITATFKAIRTLAPNLTVDAIEAQTQLDGNPVSRSTIANYLNGKI